MASEQQPTPYYRAATFAGEEPAGTAYAQLQNLIFTNPDCELSVYRFHIARVWHVAVVGDRPDDEMLGQELETALASGTLVSLASDVLDLLWQRRETESKEGTWVEHHHRPGLRFRSKE